MKFVFLKILLEFNALTDSDQVTMVVYMCSSLFHLAVESCDLSQAEKKITVVAS